MLVVGILLFCYDLFAVANAVLQGFIDINQLGQAPLHSFVGSFVVLVAVHQERVALWRNWNKLRNRSVHQKFVVGAQFLKIILLLIVEDRVGSELSLPLLLQLGILNHLLLPVVYRFCDNQADISEFGEQLAACVKRFFQLTLDIILRLQAHGSDFLL